MDSFINLTPENINNEHICCAIADKKHQSGVELKKKWLIERLNEGHVFRKLDVKGKVFIEYAPLEKAWVPIDGGNFLYIYCLWVSGSFSDKGYGKELLGLHRRCKAKKEIRRLRDQFEKENAFPFG